MKKEREFLSDLYKDRIDKLPFVNYFRENKSLRNKLFQQYLETDLKPNLGLYNNKYLTDKEIQLGMIEKDKNRPISESNNTNVIVASNFYSQSKIEIRLSEIRREFYQKVSEDTLDEKYYSNQLDKTEMFKKLSIVEQSIEDFKDKILRKNDVDLIQSAKEFSESVCGNIINTLEDVGIPKLTKAILNDFVSESENKDLLEFRYFTLKKIYGISINEAKREYRELKRYADNYINTYLIESEKVESELLSKFNHIDFVDYKEVNNQLIKLKTITNKLNYLKVAKQHLINESFIDNLRLNINIHSFDLDESSEKSIVPDNFTHDYLLRSFDIDESIKRFYYAPTRDLITDEDYKKKVNNGYKGIIDRTLRPYPIIINGAYFGRKAMYYRLLMLIELDKGVTLNGVAIKYFSDLAPYFKEYAKGFESGFNNFKKECIDPFLIEFSDKSDYINKVFEYLTKHIIFEHSWFNNHAGFSINDNFKTGVKRIVGAYKDGLKQGYFYKAWSIVFSSNQLFKPLFEDYYKLENKELQPKRESESKIPAKYYALYHYILIEIGVEKPFENKINDMLPKSEIINFAKNRHKKISSQQFYNEFKDIYYMTNRIAIAKCFGKGYKKIIIENLSNNNAKVISHLKNYPN